MSIDFRHADPCVLEAFDSRLRDCLPADVELTRLFAHAPTAFDAQVIGVLEAACEATRLCWQPIRSVAFHDAMYLAEHCPTAMLFVPTAMASAITRWNSLNPRNWKLAPGPWPGAWLHLQNNPEPIGTDMTHVTHSHDFPACCQPDNGASRGVNAILMIF